VTHLFLGVILMLHPYSRGVDEFLRPIAGLLAGCNKLTGRLLGWVVRGKRQAVVSFLVSHAPSFLMPLESERLFCHEIKTSGSKVPQGHLDFATVISCPCNNIAFLAVCLFCVVCMSLRVCVCVCVCVVSKRCLYLCMTGRDSYRCQQSRSPER
jgi:hypothetical protein